MFGLECFLSIFCQVISKVLRTQKCRAYDVENIPMKFIISKFEKYLKCSHIQYSFIHSSFIQNEYTDWERPPRNQLGSRDAALELLSDGHTVAPLIRLGYLHSLRGGKSYFMHYKHRTGERDFPQVRFQAFFGISFNGISINETPSIGIVQRKSQKPSFSPTFNKIY